MLVIDTSVLSSFTRLETLPLLNKLFSNIYTTNLVINEFSKSFKETLPDGIYIEEVKSKNLTDFPLSLSEADKSVIILAQTKGYTLATDDLNIRKFCKAHQIKVIGSIGLLKLLFLNNVIIDKDNYRMYIKNFSKMSIYQKN
jgi:predicted nucleic acid-binding protein